MLTAALALVLTQLPPGFESRQNGRRLSSIQQGIIDCRPPLLCTVSDTTLRIYQGAASDLSCVGCVSDGEIVGVSGSKVTGTVPSATALATNPTDCSTGQYAKSIDAQGNLTCEAPSGGSTPNVTCLADEALTWNGAAWGCVAKVRAAYMADAGITAQTANHATTADSATTAGSASTATTAGSADTAGTADALAVDPTACTSPKVVTDLAADGTLTCNDVTSATALAADPSDCTAGQYANAIAASGNLTCAQVAYSQVSGTPTLYNQTVQDEGGNLTQRGTLNFAGAGVSCADDTTKTTCTIAGGGSSTRTVYAANGSDTPISVAPTDPGTALVSKTLTVTAGDVITIDVYADIMNNSGATKTYTLRCRAASTTLVAVSDSTTLAASANRGSYWFRCVYAVRSTGSTRVKGELDRTPTTAANTTQTVATRSAWNTSASNWTGSQTFALNISSSATGATQDAIVTSYEITHQASNP